VVTTPKVSVVIPTRDRPHWLVSAVRSALRQDYPHLEIVIADNASGPDTRNALEPLIKSARIRYFRNAQDIGMYPNWHKAIYQYSTGDWKIILSDDDEFIDDRFISRAMELAANDDDLVLIQGDYETWTEGDPTPIREERDFLRIAPGSWYFDNYPSGRAGFLLCSTLFRPSRAPFKLFEHAEVISCDLVDFLRLCLMGNVGHIPGTCSRYRIHPGNAARRVQESTLLRSAQGVGRIPSDFAISVGYPPRKAHRWARQAEQRILRSAISIACEKSIESLLRLFLTVFRYNLPSVSIFLHPSTLLKVLFKGTPTYASIKNFEKRLLRSITTPETARSPQS
jgi:hypothetical protein